MAKKDTTASITLEAKTADAVSAVDNLTKAYERNTAAAIKNEAARKPRTEAEKAEAFKAYARSRGKIRTLEPDSEATSGLDEELIAWGARRRRQRYSAPNRLSDISHARGLLVTAQNEAEAEAADAMFGKRKSTVYAERRQHFIGNQMHKQEEARWREEMGVGPQKPTVSQNLMGTVFSSRSMNMLSALGDGNVMPAMQSIGASGFGMLRNMAAGSFGTGGSPLRALFGGGATATNQETAGEVGAAADPDVEGTLKSFGSQLEGVLGPLAKFGGVITGVVAGVAAVITGSVLLASAMNANAANYRLGIQTSIANVGGVGNASARDTWDVVMNKGHQYQYTPSVAFNTAKILGENGVMGLHGAAGIGHAMDTTLAFARQANLDPTQVAPLVGKLMQGGGRDALLVDKMFQALQVAATKANVPLARLVDSLKTLEDTTNGSGISLNGVASLAKDQNAVGMGMNIGSAVAPMMSATGSSAFAMAAMLTGGNMKQFMEAQGDPGKMLNLAGRFVRQTGMGTREDNEQMAINLAQTAGVNMSGASRKSQITMADKMLAGYDWTAHPDELKKLLSSGQNDAKAKDLAGNLVNIKDKTVLDFQYRLEELANHGFPDLGNAARHLADDGLNWAKHAAVVLGDAVLHTAENMHWLSKIIDGIPGMGLSGDTGVLPSGEPNPTPTPILPPGSVSVSQTGYIFHEPGGSKVKISGAEAQAFTMAAQMSGYSAATLIGQAYQESTLGTMGMSNGGIGQIQGGTLSNYYQDTPGTNGKWDTRGSPYANKDYFGKGKPNPYYHKKYDNNNIEQGIFAMGWWDNYNKNTTGSHTLADGLKGYHGLANGPTPGDTPQGYVNTIGNFANQVDISVTIVPTASHTAKVTVVKPPKGGRNHHTPPSHRPVAQPKRHT